MTVTLTYEPTLSRVRVDASTVGVTGVSGATTVLVERSLDQVTWTSVRCGVSAPLVSGVATIYDYEFVSDTVNYYRASIVRDITFVNVGAAAHAVNASVTPGLPAGAVANDLLLIWAAIRAGSGQVTTPTGYTRLVDVGNCVLFGKIHSGSEVAPTVSFTNGGANQDTSAQMVAFRGPQLVVDEFAKNQLQASAQNIAYPGLTVSQARTLILYLAWKGAAWTGVATLVGDGGVAVEIGDPSTTLGDDQGIVWDYVVQTGLTPTNVIAGQFVVTGGTSITSSSAVTSIPALIATQVGSITPSIQTVWLKSITRPFLNRTFPCVPPAGDITRGDRTGIFEVINRGFPVAVTDVKQSRAFSLRVITQTTTQWSELDLIVSAGDVMFLHTPLNYEVPSMYVVIGDVTEHRPLLMRRCNDDWREFTLPLREVARPDSSICGSTVTWQSVINTYASWQAVLNGETSWLDLLANVGTPNDILVP